MVKLILIVKNTQWTIQYRNGKKFKLVYLHV